MRILVAALVVALSLMFAGCTAPSGLQASTSSAAAPISSSPAAPSHSSTSAAATSSAAPTTSTEAPKVNHAPSAGLDVVVSGVNATFNLTGKDADNDSLTWSLDLGDHNSTSGTRLPGQVNHTYAMVGNITAILSVSDGTNTTLANATFTIAAAGVGQTFSGSWTAGPVGCGASYPVFQSGTPAAGVLWAEWDIAKSTIGKPFKAVFKVDSTDNLGGGLDFYDGSGMNLAGGNVATAAPWTVTGTVPAGAAYAIGYSCGGTGGSVVYTAG